MNSEYNLKGAGYFTVTDLLDFKYYQENEGLPVTTITITSRQAGVLVDEMSGHTPKLTGKKLVDYWVQPIPPLTPETIHGIKIYVED
jgi:hypothetical protein